MSGERLGLRHGGLVNHCMRAYRALRGSPMTRTELAAALGTDRGQSAIMIEALVMAGLMRGFTGRGAKLHAKDIPESVALFRLDHTMVTANKQKIGVGDFTCAAEGGKE